MTIVILGAGRVGFNLARQLINEHKEVVVIEKDADRARDLSRQLDCMTVNESGNSLEGLKKAGVENADFFISVSESDEINMISCALVSSSFKKPITIARVRNLDYSRTWDQSPGFLGINYIINPEIEVAHAIARAVEFGAISSVVEFETSNLQMRNFQIRKKSNFSGQRVEELRKIIQVPFIIAAIAREEKMIIPEGTTVLNQGDQIWVLAESKDFKILLKNIHESEKILRDIVIVGGGNIGMYVSQYLLANRLSKNWMFKNFGHKSFMRSKRNVHIVESDYNRCKELAELLPDAQITNADISEEHVLEEGRFQAYDLLIAVTGNQELNIVTAAYAGKAGIPHSIALVKKYSTAAMALNLGVNVAISINETLVNSIQKIIRKKFVRSVYNFSDSNLEMMELSLENRPELHGKKIRDIRLPGKPLIIMITRNGSHIIPSGDLVLEKDDFLMIIANKESIQELE